MKTKIARNYEKSHKILGNENILNDSIQFLIDSTKKHNRMKLRLKENKLNRLKPKAPHNTTQFLSQIYAENRQNEPSALFKPVSFDDSILEKPYSIENFIITGGSLKGINS